MNEFKINEYITLKLENGRTRIYIKGALFEQCAFLIFNITLDSDNNTLNFVSDIEFIDQLVEQFIKNEKIKMLKELKLDPNDFQTFRFILEYYKDRIEYELEYKKVTPEEIFWGYCSNLQVWSENNYDTRFLDCNLAFPLLKQLKEAGDPVATRIFSEEIVKKFECRYIPVIRFLIVESYDNYLPKNYFQTLSNQQLSKFINLLYDTLDYSKGYRYYDIHITLLHDLFPVFSETQLQDYLEHAKANVNYLKQFLFYYGNDEEDTPDPDYFFLIKWHLIASILKDDPNLQKRNDKITNLAFEASLSRYTDDYDHYYIELIDEIFKKYELSVPK